jgi:hypothetical protein
MLRKLLGNIVSTESTPYEFAAFLVAGEMAKMEVK